MIIWRLFWKGGRSDAAPECARPGRRKVEGRGAARLAGPSKSDLFLERRQPCNSLHSSPAPPRVFPGLVSFLRFCARGGRTPGQPITIGARAPACRRLTGPSTQSGSTTHTFGTKASRGRRRHGSSSFQLQIRMSEPPTGDNFRAVCPALKQNGTVKA